VKYVTVAWVVLFNVNLVPHPDSNIRERKGGLRMRYILPALYRYATPLKFRWGREPLRGHTCVVWDRERAADLGSAPVPVSRRILGVATVLCLLPSITNVVGVGVRIRGGDRCVRGWGGAVTSFTCSVGWLQRKGWGEKCEDR